MNLASKTRLIDCKGHRVAKAIILTGVRWYLAYPLSYRHLANGQDLSAAEKFYSLGT